MNKLLLLGIVVGSLAPFGWTGTAQADHRNCDFGYSIGVSSAPRYYAVPSNNYLYNYNQPSYGYYSYPFYGGYQGLHFNFLGGGHFGGGHFGGGHFGGGHFGGGHFGGGHFGGGHFGGGHFGGGHFGGGHGGGGHFGGGHGGGGHGGHH